MSGYKIIHIVAHPKNRNERYNCDNEQGYMDYLKTHQAMCEIIGDYNQFIKPIFDVDAFDKDIDIETVKQDINKIFPNKTIYYAKREPRMKNERMKFSYRFYVDKVKIYFKNLKILCEYYDLTNDKKYDLSIYSKNRLLFLPFTTKKVDEDVPKLEIVEGDIFKCSASYVEEDFEDWNNVPELNQDKKQEIVYEDIEEDEQEEEEDEVNAKKSEGFVNIFTKHLMKLSNERASFYQDWLEIIMCIINIGEKYDWKVEVIIHLCTIFSKKDKTSYNEKENKKKILQLMGSEREDKVGYKRFLQRLKEDNPDYYNINIVDNYNDVKRDFEKQYCIINNPPSIYRTPCIPRVITEDLDIGEIEQQIKECDLKFQKRNLYYNKYEKKDDKFNYVKKQFVFEWLNDPSRLTYEGIVFRPSGLPDIQKKYYKNLFSGFKADKINIEYYNDYSNIQPILDHLKMVYCAGVEEHYQYVLKWFAKIIQDPENRPQVGLVFYSKQHGTGRNTFTNFFQNEILGYNLSASARKIDRIFGRFNSILAKCMFLVIEEASGELKPFMEDFKNLITEPTFTIEKKNIDAGTYKNYVNALLLTNNPDILDIDDRDRRFAMFESSASKKDDEEYFRTLYACIKKKKNAGLFIKYLREEVDASWTPMEFQKYRPITKTYRKQQSVNAKNYIKFISHITSDEGINCNYINEKWYKYSGKILCVVPQKTLYQAYKEMCETYKYVAYPYDKFIYNITQDETGISQCTRHKTKSLKMIKEDIEKWVEIFRNSKDEPIEEFDFDLEEV
jgi:hypothetical protein